jgi:hypothetical protein
LPLYGGRNSDCWRWRKKKKKKRHFVTIVFSFHSQITVGHAQQKLLKKATAQSFFALSPHVAFRMLSGV